MRERARITVDWGYENHAITLTARNWARVKAGIPCASGARAGATRMGISGITGPSQVGSRDVSSSHTTRALNGTPTAGLAN